MAAGPNVTVNGANYTQWDKGGDWIAVDWYPINWGRYSNINFIGQALDKLRADSGGAPKKYMAYIETSWQRLYAGTRGPTKDEFRGEVWSARAYDETQVLEPGAWVEVMKIEGASALVYE